MHTILTERDFVQVALQDFYHGEPGSQVKKHMSRDPNYVSPDESILTVAEMFIHGRFQRYPVVDNGRLVGVIVRRDVMRAWVSFGKSLIHPLLFLFLPAVLE